MFTKLCFFRLKLSCSPIEFIISYFLSHIYSPKTCLIYLADSSCFTNEQKLKTVEKLSTE